MYWCIIHARFVILAGCTRGDFVYDWVQGLSGVPDEPHAVYVSDLRTEGNGVGVSKEPPVNVKVSGDDVVGKFPGDDISKVLADGAQGASSLCFKVTLSECVEVAWETVLVQDRLFVEIPCGILPTGSKERWAHTLLKQRMASHSHMLCLDCLDLKLLSFSQVPYAIEFLVITSRLSYLSY